MRTSRLRVALAVGAMSATLLVARPGAAQVEQPLPQPQQETEIWYPSTLYFGSGLINTPVAWVAPSSGEVYVTVTGKDIPAIPGAGFSSNWNTNGAVETHWFGRFTIGASLYSQNPEWGFFGQVLVLKEQANKSYPAIAIGFRNLGPYTHEDRFLIGHDIKLDSSGAYVGETPGTYSKFNTSPTIYGVATKHWNLGSAQVGGSIGYGSGMFSDDGGLGKSYNDKGTIVKGLFLGANVNFHPSANTIITLMGENDGWDWNAGVVGNWRGVFLGAYATELEEGSKSPSKGAHYTVYNYTKFNLALGYSGNIHAIGRGTILRAEVTDLEREQSRLQSEIVQREKRIATLEVSLRKAQAGELAEVSKRREALQSQINEERDAIKRAEDRLTQLQQGTVKPPAPVPAAPPSAAPTAAPATPPAAVPDSAAKPPLAHLGEGVR